jgi:imidazolonepropionase-like amidohydrolase
MATTALTHRRLLIALAVAVLSTAESSRAVTADVPQPAVIVLASRVLDVKSGHYLQAAAVLIVGERIENVGPAQTVIAHAAAGAVVINLHDATILPGLIDCHTRLMARIPEEENATT